MTIAILSAAAVALAWALHVAVLRRWRRRGGGDDRDGPGGEPVLPPPPSWDGAAYDLEDIELAPARTRAATSPSPIHH